MSNSNSNSKLSDEGQTILSNLEMAIRESHFLWACYRKLFCEDPETGELMNSVSGPFFHLVQRCLQRESVLSICRILDPQKSGGQKTASMAGFGAEVLETHPVVAAEVTMVQKELRLQANPLFVHRNKFIAHRDLGTVVEMGASFPPMTFPEVTGVVVGLGRAYNSIVQILGHKKVDFSGEESMEFLDSFLSKMEAISFDVGFGDE